MFRNAIYNASEVVTYDWVKEIFLERDLLEDRLPLRIIASTAAGIAAVIFGSPTDVIKVRIMSSKSP